MASPLLVFASGNAGKLEEMRLGLPIPVEGISLELEEIQSTNMEAITLHKVNHAFAELRRPVFVEDTGLFFEAWGSLPGPFTRYFLESMKPAGLVKALRPFQDWRAEAVTIIGYHDGQQNFSFAGQTAGSIVPPRGTRGFGWDPIFIPDGQSLSFAEMEPSLKLRHSMRGKAIRAFAAHLQKHGY